MPRKVNRIEDNGEVSKLQRTGRTKKQKKPAGPTIINKSGKPLSNLYIEEITQKYFGLPVTITILGGSD